jgi:hypothetical protein
MEDGTRTRQASGVGAPGASRTAREVGIGGTDTTLVVVPPTTEARGLKELEGFPLPLQSRLSPTYMTHTH